MNCRAHGGRTHSTRLVESNEESIEQAGTPAARWRRPSPPPSGERGEVRSAREDANRPLFAPARARNQYNMRAPARRKFSSEEKHFRDVHLQPVSERPISAGSVGLAIMTHSSSGGTITSPLPLQDRG